MCRLGESASRIGRVVSTHEPRKKPLRHSFHAQQSFSRSPRSPRHVLTRKLLIRWWAHRRSGPSSSWITDAATKLQFVVSTSGVVTGMNFQTMPDEELSFFQRLE